MRPFLQTFRAAPPTWFSPNRSHPHSPVFEGCPIPDVLLSGDHAKVAAWRRAEAERITRERRPDLWEAHRRRSKSPNESP